MKLEPWRGFLILLQPQNKTTSYNGLKVSSRAVSKILMQLDLIGIEGDPQTSPNLSLSWIGYTLAKNPMDPFAFGSLVMSKVNVFKKFWWKEVNWKDLAYVDSCKKQRISTLRSLWQLTTPLPQLAFISALLKPFQDSGDWEARATCLLACPCNKPFSAPNSKVFGLFGFTRFGNNNIMDRILINPEEKGWSFDSNWSSNCKPWGFWASSGKWWRTGKPVMLQSVRSQRVRHARATKQQLGWMQGKAFSINLVITRSLPSIN